MIILYNTNFTHNPNAYLTLGVHAALKRLVGDKVVLADNRTLLPLAATGKFDTLICIDGQRLNKSLIRHARGAFQRCILWLFEDPFMSDYNRRNIDVFDVVYTNDPSCVALYGSKGRFLSLGASTDLHFREIKPDSALNYDIFFAGTMWPNRIPILEKLIATFPAARFKLICPTNEYLPPLPASLAALALQRPVSHEAFIDFANASRVTLTMFRNYASHGEASQATAPGPRLYELGLAGTAQVVEAGSAIGREHFRELPGVTAVDDTNALLDAVGRLLRDPKRRAAQAGRTQEAVRTSHLYEHRLKTLLDRELSMAHRPAPEAGSRSYRREGRKLRILMCTHSTIQENQWGGVEVYQRTLCSMLEKDAEIFFWLRRGGACQLLDSNGKSLERFETPDVGWLDTLCDQFEEMALSSVLATYRIDVVHFQHLGHHAASLPMIAKAAGCGTVFSAHDFFLVCARYNLLNFEQKFCDIGTKSISACDVCLKVAEGLPVGVQQQRRGFMEQVIRSIDVLLFGSDYSRNLLRRIFPFTARTRTVTLGIPSPANAVPDLRQEKASHSGDYVLEIAVVGNFIRSKGADAVLNIITTAPASLFKFHIFGQADPQYEKVFATLGKPNLIYHGRFNPGDVAVAATEVALHLSIWPETYCISLSEVWQAGLIPIVTNIGALGDRVIHGVNGFKVDVGDVSAVLDCLELLRSSADVRTAIRANITPELWVDSRAYARTVLEIYHDVAPVATLDSSPLKLDVGQLHLLPKAGWKDLTPSRHIFDPPRPRRVQLTPPPGLRSWITVQGAENYIDELCGIGIDDLQAAEDVFPCDSLMVRGWIVVPDLHVAGRVDLCLVQEGGPLHIFAETEREGREDVLELFPDAPSRSGFLARLTLNGKWSDGEYRLAVINLVGEQGAFQLTPIKLRLYEGRVAGATSDPPSNDTILAAFARIDRLASALAVGQAG
ncbi:glycosyltransferase [Acidisoma sp. L85]|uniref:glycosyltransferase family protein n=1 Tax=Acidisoma sp. L85 TaxID=1641850 RepID=UPI00131DFC99|nr:glycosyltransferase [Acidisoma sp. L85]